MSEIIPIPNDRASEKKPINLEFEPQAFPGQRFAIRLDWNATLGKYVLEFEHLRREYVITHSVATLELLYAYMPFLIAFFADPSREVDEITPENLGDEVRLYIYPGPSGRVVDED